MSERVPHDRISILSGKARAQNVFFLLAVSCIQALLWMLALGAGSGCWIWKLNLDAGSGYWCWKLFLSAVVVALGAGFLALIVCPMALIADLLALDTDVSDSWSLGPHS